MAQFIYGQLFVTPKYPTDDLDSKYVIVTGSNTGLGKEAARHFARMGASKVIMAVRNVKAGEAAKQDIISTTQRDPSAVEVWELDLSSFDSCKAFAARASNLPRVDVFLENAGIATGKFDLAGGFERTVLVNVVSTFYLALLMMPKLKATATQYKTTPRLTIVTSEVHAWTKFEEQNAPAVFTALNDRSQADMNQRYQTSKLLEVLVVRQLAPRLEGSGVIMNMLNPGLCNSELSREGKLSVTILKLLLARTTEVGARTLVASCVAGQDSHGKYMSNGLVHDNHLSAFARSEDGEKVGTKVWTELSDIFERIQPGITKNL